MIRIYTTSLLLAIGLGLIAGIILPRPVAAQEILQANPAIEEVISNQLQAFDGGDVAEAWQYASPNIQRIFQEPERFGAMVEQAFPMVWDPSSSTFIDLQAFGGLMVQRVEIIDENGIPHYLGYAMVETAEGWRINGVQMLPAPSVGA